MPSPINGRVVPTRSPNRGLHLFADTATLRSHLGRYRAHLARLDAERVWPPRANERMHVRDTIAEIEAVLDEREGRAA
jgi:hypothetical protein